MTETIVIAEATASEPGRLDSRFSYAAFAFAFVFGHGAFAVSKGPDPLLDLPPWLPFVLLGIGVVPGVALAFIAGNRAQRGAGPDRIKAEKLLGTAWATGFVALALGVTGLTTTFDVPEAGDVLWPVGAVFVVGMINIAEGAVRRNTLHYNLGSWLTLVSAAALFLDTPGPFWVLALAGGGAYLLAALLEPRRLAALD
ncbi:hypothetical protein [Glycomyces sp. NRRL B-16210]|uniref:hypothetical protein n=1 Tax=Glycomyces sp. NRRL B-16210 TaxID=1463821 RepID=UPI0005514F27|nr:hypothetical protein [Glycomyces sp. NRRL B-16210]